MPDHDEAPRRPDAWSRLAAALPPPLDRLVHVEQVRYLLVAGTTSLFYLSLVAAGLALGLHYMVAIAAAQVITITGAFPAYRTLVSSPHVATGGATWPASSRSGPRAWWPGSWPRPLSWSWPG
ncbi:hypothetical protein [Ornithinimicrobium sp. W1665]|uniref:hypothetical protein n=1 Tax=Ornithinimicrobium sp. W1665 TaxID=3416666 RepID=UPI003D6C527E